MVNDLPDELLISDYPTGGPTDDVTSALGNKQDSTLNKHVQLSALLQNTNQSNPVPSRSPNVMNNNPLNSHRSPLSNSLSSPPHTSMVGKPVSAGNDLNFVSSSAVFMSNANSISSMGTMANSNVMSSLGSHGNVCSIPSSMGGFSSMAQRNPMMPNGPQYTISGQPGQGRNMGPGPQMPNLPSGMMNMNNQMRVNIGHPVLQQNVGNQQSQLLNVSSYFTLKAFKKKILSCVYKSNEIYYNNLTFCKSSTCMHLKIFFFQQNGPVGTNHFNFNQQKMNLGQPVSSGSPSMAAIMTTPSANMPGNSLVSNNSI